MRQPEIRRTPLDIKPVAWRQRHVRGLVRVRGDGRRLVRSAPFLTVLGLATANLLASLTFGLSALPVPASRFVLEILYANFAPFAVTAVVAAAVLPAARSMSAIVARLVVSTGVVGGCLMLAGATGIAFQLAYGETPDLALYLGGLAINLAWRLFQLAALVVLAQTLLGQRLGAVAAAAVFFGSNLAFDHLLLAYGVPVTPWSALDGYGPFLLWHVAAGIYWSAVSVLLVAAAIALGHPRQRWRQRLAGHAGTVAWAACVIGAVCAGWIHHNVYAGTHFRSADAPDQMPEERPHQPEYSRLGFSLDIFPSERRLAVQARAIVVNRTRAPIADLHLAFPPWLHINEVRLTGHLLEQRRGYRRYGLNRPLEPTETLLVEYAAEWQAAPLPIPGRRVPLLANGTFLVSADLVPTLGHRFSPTRTFASEGEVVFSAVIGTALEQTVVAPGALTRAWREENRAYFEYRTAAAIPARFSIHSGRYAKQEHRADGRAIDIYCHAERTESLVAERAELVRRLPLRVVVVPDFGSIARGIGLHQLGWRQPATVGDAFNHLAPAGVWPVSERHMVRVQDAASRPSTPALAGLEVRC